MDGKGKKIFIIIFSVLLLCGVFFYFLGPRESYSRVSVLLTFENIDRGFYPDGTPFDKSDLLSAQVLHEVVEELQLEEQGIGTADLRRQLEVAGAVERERIREVEARQGEGETYSPVIPSEYRISFMPRGEQSIDSELQGRILDTVVQKYKENYRLLSGLEQPLPRPFIDLMELGDSTYFDYPFLPMLLDLHMEQLLHYAEELKARGRAFRSPSLGITFADLISEIERLQEFQVGRIRSVVQENRLTRDAERSARRIEEIIRELELELARKERQEGFSRELLAELEAVSPEEPLPEGATNIIDVLIRHDYYTELLGRSLEAGLEAGELLVELNYYREQVEELREEEPPPQRKEELIEQVDREMSELLAEVEQYMEHTETMRREMLERETERAVTRLRGPELLHSGRGFLNTVGTFALAGLAAGAAFSYYLGGRKEHKEEIKEEG